MATPPSGTFIQVSAGGEHTCGINSNESIQCWGTDIFALGTVTPPSGTFMYLSASMYHTCAVASSGLVQCWGMNDSGQSSPPSGFSVH